MASFALLKRYMAAITILSIIWAVIGWSFADYLEVQSWYGKAVVSAFFIVIIVQIERFIILSNGKLAWLKAIRISVAISMALLGATVFDQVIFENDIDMQRIGIRTDRINAETTRRTHKIDSTILTMSSTINSLENANRVLQKDVRQNPYVQKPQETTPVRNRTGTDEQGNPIYEYASVVKQGTAPNPGLSQIDRNQGRIDSLNKEKATLEESRSIVENGVREEYKKKKPGMLEGLKAMYSLLAEKGNEPLLVFYAILFFFLLSLELLVVMTKGNDCDYELILEFQEKQQQQLYQSPDRNKKVVK